MKGKKTDMHRLSSETYADPAPRGTLRSDAAPTRVPNRKITCNHGNTETSPFNMSTTLQKHLSAGTDLLQNTRDRNNSVLGPSPEEQHRVTTRILQLTLEIIHLLTGEVYGPITETRKAMMENPNPHSAPEKNKEWRHLEGHCGLDKAAMMEDQPITSPDGSWRNNPSLGSTQEERDSPLQGDGLIAVKMEDGEEASMRGHDRCAEEEICPQINTDGSRNHNETITDEYINTEERELVVQLIKEDIPLEIVTDDVRTEGSLIIHLDYPGQHQAENVIILNDEVKETGVGGLRVQQHLTEEAAPPNIGTDKSGIIHTPRPLHVYLQASTQKADNFHYQGDGLTGVKLERQRETLVSGNERCAVEKVLTELSTDSNGTFVIQRNIRLEEEQVPMEITEGQYTNDMAREDPVTSLHYDVSHTSIRANGGTEASFDSTSNTRKKEGNPYWCSECGKSFKNKWSLLIHVRSHTGEKPFACLKCGKTFIQNSDLMRHDQVHTGDYPFSCSQCGKGFSQKSHLTVHERTHSGERPYSCTVCGRSFHMKTILLRHLRIHTGDKPFSCLVCGKSFAQKSDLTKHQRTHTGEKPYACSHCGERFACSSGLARHRRTHLDEAR